MLRFYVVVLVASSGCFVEARGRADIVSGTGSAVGGGSLSIGVEAALLIHIEPMDLVP